METIKAINEWGFQLLMLVLIPVGIGWLCVGMVEVTKIVAQEWFKSKPGTGDATKGEATKGANQ